MDTDTGKLEALGSGRFCEYLISEYKTLLLEEAVCKPSEHPLKNSHNNSVNTKLFQNRKVYLKNP